MNSTSGGAPQNNRRTTDPSANLSSRVSHRNGIWRRNPNNYGTASQTYTEEVPVNNPGIATYVVENLPSGTYYFAVGAYNANGVESLLSDEVSATLN